MCMRKRIYDGACAIFSKERFMAARHHELRDITAKLLSQVCNDAIIEPKLGELTGDTFRYRTANTKEDARLDVAARGFWTRGSKAYFDVRIFNPTANSYTNLSSNAAHIQNENEKKRQYNERVIQGKHGTFTPLVFTCFGGMGPECKTFFKKLSIMIAEPLKDRYVDV